MAIYVSIVFFCCVLSFITWGIMKKVLIYIDGEHINLTFYEPVGDKIVYPPVIILCHELCGIQAWILPVVVRRFTTAGFAVVTFDYRGFGESGGERFQVNLASQQEDLNRVIAWVKGLYGSKKARIGLWATGLGCWNALAVAPKHPEIQGMVCHLPWGKVQNHFANRTQAWRDIQHLFPYLGRLQNLTGEPLSIPLSKALNDKDANRFYTEARRQNPDVAAHLPLSSIVSISEFDILHQAAMCHVPTFVILPGMLTSSEKSDCNALYHALRGTKALRVLSSRSYYRAYDPLFFKKELSRSVFWFVFHLHGEGHCIT